MQPAEPPHNESKAVAHERAARRDLVSHQLAEEMPTAADDSVPS